MERLITSDPRLAVIEPRVVQAASGQQGLAVFVSERPDLIITDLYMPAMDGFAMCRSVREASFGKDIPIIVISGVYKDPTLASSLGDEVQAYFLPKPLQADDLMRTILTCLGQPVPEQEGADATMPATPLPPEGNIEALQTASAFLPAQPRVAPFEPVGLTPPPSSGPQRTATPIQEALAGSPPRADDPLGSGSLSDMHVGRLIFDLAETTLTGTLSLAHGKVRKDFFVRGGRVVAADSNLRQEALGTLLRAKGILEEDQLTFLLVETKKRGHKMGAVLIELGWLTPEEVLQCLAAQARKRIVDCLRWDEGSYSFTQGDTFGERVIEHDLDVAQAVFLGLYRSATPEALVNRFDHHGACPVLLTPRFDRYKVQFDETFGGDFASIIANTPTIGALSLREDAHVVMAEIEALLDTGLAELGEQVEEADPPPSPLESSFSLEKLGAELNKRFDAIVDSSLDMSFMELHKGDGSPPSLPASAQAAVDSNSGALAIGYGTRPERRSGTHIVTTPSSELRQRLLHEYLMIHGKSHYDILGATPQTPTGQIEEAVRAKLESFSDRALAGVEIAPSDQARLEAVRTAIKLAGQILCAPATRADYDHGLGAAKAAGVDPLGAELAFGEAMQLFQSDRFDEALGKFEAAVRARPDQALYHAYLGWADFVAKGPSRLEEARERLHHALALDPDLAEAHAMLGRLAATENDARTARRHLEQSLAIDPEQADALDLLLEAYSRLPEPDPRGAERFLRSLVSALGERAETLRSRLWLELGALYEGELSDRTSARIAYDTAARLTPRNLGGLRKSGELNAEDPARWQETARALAAEWHLHPKDGEPANRLLALLARSGQQEAVATTAAAMVLRGLADPSVRKLADDDRPRSLRRIQGPLPANLLARAGYRPEESDLERLAALLVETSVLKPFAREELGLSEGDLPLPAEEQPPTFRDVLRYICDLLDVGAPEAVICLPVLGGDARMADLRPPALLCGQLLLATEDTVELGFRLGRAMALGAPGRRAGSARSGGQMRPYFIAALALANAAGPVKGAAALEASKTIAALDVDTQFRILEVAQAIKQKYDNLNLSLWGKGLARVATRLALLISGDLLRVGRAVVEEDGPAALEDLLIFAVSLDYFDLRRDLGFAAS